MWHPFIGDIFVSIGYHSQTHSLNILVCIIKNNYDTLSFVVVCRVEAVVG